MFLYDVLNGTISLGIAIIDDIFTKEEPDNILLHKTYLYYVYKGSLFSFTSVAVTL